MQTDLIGCILRIMLMVFWIDASRFQLSILKQGAVDRHISVSHSLDHRPHMYSQDTRSQVISPVILYQQLV